MKIITKIYLRCFSSVSQADILNKYLHEGYELLDITETNSNYIIEIHKDFADEDFKK